MEGILNQFLKEVLLALYQPFGYALLTAVLTMFLYLYIQESGGNPDGVRKVFHRWKEAFLHDSRFRRFFALAFYTIMILFRTLLNRNLWENPLSNLLGGWLLVEEDGYFNTEPIENLILFLPFTMLLLWASGEGGSRGKKGLFRTVWRSGLMVFLFSALIEFLQLLLRLGTVQFSDLFYNTVGGALGGLFYCVLVKFRRYLRKPDRAGHKISNKRNPALDKDRLQKLQ